MGMDLINKIDCRRMHLVAGIRAQNNDVTIAFRAPFGGWCRVIKNPIRSSGDGDHSLFLENCQSRADGWPAHLKELTKISFARQFVIPNPGLNAASDGLQRLIDERATFRRWKSGSGWHERLG